MPDNLKKRTMGALLWNLVDRLGQQLLQFVIAIVVANLLCPDDYALVGMLAIFTAISTILIESGFGAALIQKSDADERDFSTVFWFNLVMSIAIYFILLLGSPLIASFFNEPRLVSISAVVFAAIPINGISLIQTTVLSKQINFKPITQADIAGVTAGGITSLVLALLGFGVWALAVQPVAQAVVRSCMLWFGSKWRPRRYFKFSILRQFWGYSFSLMLSSMINTCFINVYSVVVPKLYPKRQLGYITQANKICDPFVALVYGSIQNATFPIFSSIQHDEERLIRSFRKTIRFTSFLTFPLLFGIIGVAPAVFHLLFKSEWWPAIPFLQILAVGGCFTILTSINNNFIKVSGRSMGILKTELSKIVLTIIVILLLRHCSVLMMVAGIVSVRLLVHLIYMYYTQRYTGYHIWQQCLDTVPYALIAGVMLALVWAAGYIQLPALPTLLLQIAIGVVSYVGISYLLGSKILAEAIQLVLKRNKQ